MSETTSLVLLAVADPVPAALCQVVLECHGFDVAAVRNRYDAVEVALRDRPALLVVDAELPPLDPIALCRVLKARRATGAIPILVMTKPVDRARRCALVAGGADQILAEPCAPELLAIEARRLARPRAAGRRRGPLRRATDTRGAAPRS